jgi:ubiquinone/menaquinone biosynthesis C-methylase UbiE
MAQQGYIFGIDHSTAMLVQAARRNRRLVREGRVHLLHGRFDALPLRSNSIDKILAVHVVYFIDIEAMREANRVLRSGGVIAVLATDRRVMENWEFVKTGKHRLFDRDELAALLLAGGFAQQTIAVSAIRLRFGIPALLGIAGKS